jgi:hypothetical protein
VQQARPHAGTDAERARADAERASVDARYDASNGHGAPRENDDHFPDPHCFTNTKYYTFTYGDTYGNEHADADADARTQARVGGQHQGAKL